jgi:hypothetical protein
LTTAGGGNPGVTYTKFRCAGFTTNPPRETAPGCWWTGSGRGA